MTGFLTTLLELIPPPALPPSMVLAMSLSFPADATGAPMKVPELVTALFVEQVFTTFHVAMLAGTPAIVDVRDGSGWMVNRRCLSVEMFLAFGMVGWR
jgi:hypothetical protein